MGSSSSKVAGRAAGAARRQYPSTSSITNTGPSTSNAPLKSTNPAPAPAPAPAQVQVRPSPAASPPAAERSEQIDLDGRDPQFDSVLRSLGPAKPASTSEDRPVEDAFPTSSQPMQQGRNIFPTSAQNPAIMLVQARERINRRWESELDNQGRRGFAGRTVVSAKDVKEALALRDEAGKSSSEIETQLSLKPGILDQLVPRRVVANA
ncbi:hypothetical protein A1O3_08871 [Capronia epimyces CBS 606.96]|uniref:Helix-turn-helix domain-containing protein n=1 Tax=Capronia epimyces CBS 606.96 TaxID=1182542 RepID=W9YAI2_9EURO|nr:uncharacterized protein A1O3_08871 [Capronia epimyces CBS 606.96]EXJ79369.1 hypothetical protein A1O3_08871 [Capronia epimyces CBS 606.96]